MQRHRSEPGHRVDVGRRLRSAGLPPCGLETLTIEHGDVGEPRLHAGLRASVEVLHGVVGIVLTICILLSASAPPEGREEERTEPGIGEELDATFDVRRSDSPHELKVVLEEHHMALGGQLLERDAHVLPEAAVLRRPVALRNDDAHLAGACVLREDPARRSILTPVVDDRQWSRLCSGARRLEQVPQESPSVVGEDERLDRRSRPHQTYRSSSKR